MLPPRSPFSLLQEDAWPDEWRILVICIMLNCTSRKQLDPILPVFFERWPSPESFIDAPDVEVYELIKSLGFGNKRTEKLKDMSVAYVGGNWQHAEDLPHIGEYGGRAWEIFCRGVLGSDEPNDGALKLYWRWRIAQDERKKKITDS